jgi:hypothetical protein
MCHYHVFRYITEQPGVMVRDERVQVSLLADRKPECNGIMIWLSEVAAGLACVV